MATRKTISINAVSQHQTGIMNQAITSLKTEKRADLTIPLNDISCSTPSDLVDEMEDIVLPPDICLNVMDLVHSENSSARDIGEVIARDPNLTSRLLRLVNSPFFGFSAKIDTVSRAISMVGTREIYNLVIAVSAVKSFSNISNQLVNMDTFWRHSLFTALIARSLAKRCGLLHPERMFVAGMLHDLGLLVLFNRAEDASRDLLLIADGDEELFYQAELDMLGFSHCDIGGQLLRRWNLPEELQQTVACHHNPNLATGSGLEAAIIYTASILANQSEIGAYCEQPRNKSDMDPSTWALLGLNENEFNREEVIGEAGLQFADTVSVLFR